MRGAFAILAIAVLLAIGWCAENADPALAPWFQSLKAPDTGIGCCSVSDCRPVVYRQSGEGYEALIQPSTFPAARESVWVKVPPEKILQRTENPTGKAILCYTPAMGVMCFVRPAEG